MVDANQNRMGPDLLPGKSGGKLMLRGNFIMMIFGLLVVAFAFESYFGSNETLYIVTVATVMAVGVLSGYATYLWGWRKKKREIEHGYTATTNIAIDNSALFLVDYKTLDIISAPYEARPPRRKWSD